MNDCGTGWVNISIYPLPKDIVSAYGCRLRYIKRRMEVNYIRLNCFSTYGRTRCNRKSVSTAYMVNRDTNKKEKKEKNYSDKQFLTSRNREVPLENWYDFILLGKYFVREVWLLTRFSNFNFFEFSIFKFLKMMIKEDEFIKICICVIDIYCNLSSQHFVNLNYWSIYGYSKINNIWYFQHLKYGSKTLLLWFWRFHKIWFLNDIHI